MAFVYSHGGAVFDTSNPEGLSIRGRNIMHSVKSAAASGAESIFVSEAVYPGNVGQIRMLVDAGRFDGIEDRLDVAEYPVAQGVSFPKNYLFNRGAQRAAGFFAITFSDSDVLYKPDFPSRALNTMKRVEFAQPDTVIYLDPTCSREQYRADFTMKGAVLDASYEQAILYLPGMMPGMVNIVRRDSFLDIGGFSQAISGVNWEDMEYQYRLKMLRKHVGYIPAEIVMHMFHPRGVEFAKKEGTGSMYLKNLNFMCWLVSYLGIHGNMFNAQHFSHYMKLINESLKSNNSLVGPYTNMTGSITPDFDPNKRYRSYVWGQAEPYTDWVQPKEVQCEAILAAAEFWRTSPEEILMLSKSYQRAFTVSLEDVLEYQKRRHGQHPEDDLDALFKAILSRDDEEDLDDEFESIMNR